MTGKEIVKALLVVRGFTKEALGEKIGKSETDIKGYVNRGKNDMRVDILVQLLEAMDCELVVRSKLKDKSEWIVGKK